MSSFSDYLRKNWDYLSLAAIVAYATLSIKTFYRPGILIGWDHPNYINQAWLTLKYLLPKGRLLGWDPLNQYGWPLNQFYYCGPHSYVALLAYGLLNFMDFYTIYKLALNVVYASYALTIYAYVRTLTADRIGAVVAALLAVTVFPGESAWLDAGLRQIYEVGMWGQSMGIILSFSALALMIRTVDLDLGLKWFTVCTWAAFLSASAMVTHPMVFFSLAISIAVLMAMRILSLNARILWRTFLDYGLIVCFTVASSAFWLIPMLKYNKTYHNLVWNIKWDVGKWALIDIVETFKPYTWLMISLALLAIPLRVWIWTRSVKMGLREKLGVVFLLLGFSIFTASLVSVNPSILILATPFLLASYIVYKDDCYHPLISSILLLWIGAGYESFRIGWVDLTRVIPFYEELAFGKCVALARYMLIVLASVGFSRTIYILKNFGRKNTIKPTSVILRSILTLTLIFISLGSQLETTDILYPLNRRIVFPLSVDYSLPARVDELIEWIQDSGKSNTYILVQDTLGVVNPPSHYVYLTSLMSNTPTIGGIYGTRYITDPIANTEGGRILSMDANRLANDLGKLDVLTRELGVTYIAVINPSIKNSLKQNGYVMVFSNGLFEVFRMKTFNPIVSIENSTATIRILNYNVDSVILEFRGAKIDDRVRIRMVYYPELNVKVNGRPTTVIPYYPPNLSKILGVRVPFMEILLPTMNGVITITYEPDPIPYAISLATLVFSLTATAIYLIGEVVKTLRLSFKRKYE
ncbi:hypothetical protein KEJ27_02335 [Candidatus Bathyarchaeota archaeon]|nr:hypothetical protein [Candidatus Bathyarchaeota archaeon]MBS7613658.1 hypothetical protein [Candidatus Bathyarchaeota archaeon]MBS7618036.1 hypothetical protein [Candidatus Bathyarchaeota archaeon]